MDSGLDLDAHLSPRASSIPSAPSLTPVGQSYPSHAVAPHATLQPSPATPPAAAPGSAGEDPFGGRRGSRVQTLRKRIGGMVAAIVALIAKFFTAIKGLLLLLPKIKLLTTTGTALVSVAAYSLFFGWEFAAGFVLLLFVHEMGHVFQLRREGISASAPMFIPFLGAAVFSKSLGDNALAEARVGLAGPILGTLGAAVCLALAEAVNSDLLRALAYVAFFLNLINLIPVVPFDGGRAMAAMAPWMWFMGLGALVALLLLTGNPFLLIFLLLGFLETRRRWRERKTRSLEQAAYYRVAPRHRVYVGVVYIGLIVVLVLGMDVSHILASGGHSFGSL
ncbi:MAG TPA: site-2 protease family protein [Solirubrobacteraceae bacterium]|jgi:Zn-dependent protease|nr:site-2 protease family protein [Solirubrobacteraceae bacterium]